MKKAVLATCAVALAALGLSVTTAGADPVGSGSARGFGATLSILGEEVVPPSAEASVTAPPFADDAVSTLIAVPADPLAVNLTANGIARVHQASDLVSELEFASQTVAGPYNAQGIGSVEDLEVLPGGIDEGVALIEADLIRGEAVAVCAGGVVQYSANSEVVNLEIAGEEPLNGPLNDLVQAIEDLIDPLADIVDIELNVVTPIDGGGIAVDAVVVTVLQVIGEDMELVDLTLGHAEVGPLACADTSNPGQVVKDGPQEVTAGDSFDYTITVRNIGTRCDLTTVKVTDTITGPAGSEITGSNPAANSTTGTIGGGGAVLTWNDVGPIAPGGSKVLTVTIKTPSNAPNLSEYVDTVGVDFQCAGTPFTVTDTIRRPRVNQPTARTGIEMSTGLFAGGGLVLAALTVGLLRRRATAA